MAKGSFSLTDDVVRRLHSLSDPMDEKFRQRFADFLQALEVTDDRQTGLILKELWQYGMTGDLYRSIVALVNEHFLKPRQREMTTHGVKRTFRFWSQEEKAAYLRYCNEIVERISGSVTNNVCFGYGAVLALARSDDLIPHDDDIDLLVALPADEYPRFADARDRIASAFPAEDFKIFNAAPNLLHVQSPARRLTVDIFACMQEGGYFVSYPGPRRSLKMRDLYPAATRSLLGAAVPVPAATERYLRAVYGWNWRKPQPYFFHKEDREAFAQYW